MFRCMERPWPLWDADADSSRQTGSSSSPSKHEHHTSLFRKAVRRFDQENARDPNTELVNGIARPRELVHAEWLTDWVLRLCPDASEPLRLAARCQHICRWTIPRDSYPLTRAGYLQWRQKLKQFHAHLAGEILREVGYPESVIERVQALNLKKDFPSDPDSRVLEDALCLVFLEHQFAALARKTSEETMLNTLRKTWAKMTSKAQAIAAELTYGELERTLLEKALRPTPPE